MADVQTELENVPSETGKFLDFYLNVSPTFQDAMSCSSSAKESAFNCRVSNCLSPLDSFEVLLAAHNNLLSTLRVRRNHTIPSEYGLQNNPKLGGPRRALTITPPLAVYSAVSSRSTERELPLIAICEVNNRSPLLPEGTKTSSARAVAASLDDLFSNAGHADPPLTHLHGVHAVTREVATAVSYALLSNSGISAVTNGIHTLLFRVDHSSHSRSRPVSVRVSCAYRSDSCGRGSPARALIAAVRAAGMVVEGKMDRVAEVRKCAITVGNANAESFVDDRVHGNYSSLISSLGVGAEEEARVVNDAIETLLQRNEGVLEVGCNGVVLKSVFNGMSVMVKYWNERDLDGLDVILHEIRMYEFLRRTFPHVLGKAVPRLILSRDAPQTEATLVTELIGQSLKRSEDGLLRIGDESTGWELVGYGEERKIIEAVRQSLDVLHRCRVSHGYINLCNVRVQRQRTALGWSWRALWVDLGHAEEEMDSVCSQDFDVFRFEMEMVEKLLFQD